MADSSDSEFREDLKECLSQQVAEMELMQSMYPNADEMHFMDNTMVDTVIKFISEPSDILPPQIDFVLTIHINKRLKLEICVNLPTLYPKICPDVTVRCNQLSRQQETLLNNKLAEYIQGIPRGESCLYTVITWLQEEAHNLEDEIKKSNGKVKQETQKEKFARYWIYSHHIYNKRKRESIINSARVLNLNGFSLAGKPGIVCIEGDESNCKEWWGIIKSLTWQKIIIRQIEVFTAEEKNTNRKFHNFEEIRFANDMSSFSKYMDNLGLSDKFNEIFGFNGDLG